MTNYLQIRGRRLFSPTYVFIDTKEHIFVNLMNENSVSIKNVKESARPGSPFRLIFCDVKKKDIGKFQDALNKLRNKALLLGYRDYDGVCEKLQNLT